MISLYVAQVTRLQAALRDLRVRVQSNDPSDESGLDEAWATGTDIQVATVDSFQGGEKDVIFLSCCRSSDPSTTGSGGGGSTSFVDAPTRVNVAITRARRHLFMIGNATTLSTPSSAAAVTAAAVDAPITTYWKRVIGLCRTTPSAYYAGAAGLTRLQQTIQRSVINPPLYTAPAPVATDIITTTGDDFDSSMYLDGPPSPPAPPTPTESPKQPSPRKRASKSRAAAAVHDDDDGEEELDFTAAAVTNQPSTEPAAGDHWVCTCTPAARN